MRKYVSMLNTTQNTRELGGYQTVYGVPTREMTVIRSDVQCCPDEEDCLFLKTNGITTIIDMRGAKDVLKKPSGFCGREGFTYYNFPIDEGSGIPASVDEVPKSYMRIASAKSVSDVFVCIANADRSYDKLYRGKRQNRRGICDSFAPCRGI